MATTWILSANTGRARLFSETDSSKPLQEIEDMVNPDAQLRAEDAVTDRIGQFAASNTRHAIGASESAGLNHNAKAGAPSSQYEPNRTPAQHQADLFARDVAQYLLKAHQEDRFQQLVIAAGPEFLGLLRQQLDPQLSSLIKAEYNKDYTHSNAQELREQLQAQQAKSE
jgi:protein required for attachment to host cells